MRTTSATRQDLAPTAKPLPAVLADPPFRFRPDEASAPKSLTWLVYCRDNKLLTASEWALAAILVTLGQGQNITLSVVGMADITGQDRKTVRKAIDSLIAKGLMVFVKPGSNQKSVYRLTMPRCPNGDHLGGETAPTQVRNPHPPGRETAPTTSTRDQELDQQHINMRSAQDDDADAPSGKTKGRAKASARLGSTSRPKGGARSGSSARAKDDSPADDHPALEKYIADIEGCVDDLAGRLGIDPGLVNIKALAKSWRDLMIRHGQTYSLSSVVEAFPADNSMWTQCVSKHNPVGYFLNVFDRELAEDAADVASRADQ